MADRKEWKDLSMRERSELIRNGVKSGMTNLSDIRSDYKLKSDNARVVIPEYKVNKVEPIKLTEEQQFNMKHFGQLTAPQNRQYIGRPTNESRQSRDIARDNVVNRERLERFENERAADRERELKVVPYATMGAIGLATGTLPEMIAADLGGRAVDYGSEKLTGKSWGENALPEYPMIGGFTNPGYLIGGVGKAVKAAGPLVERGIQDGGEYLLNKIEPYMLGDKKIPMTGYSPKQELWNPFKKEAPFKSEINWGNWNKEIPENTELIKEYNAIEQTTKANGTWMKNPDGSIFKGTPEQFVQQNSINFKKAFPDYYGKILNHNSSNKFNQFSRDYFGTASDNGWYGEGVYMHPSKEYTKPYGDINYELYVNSKNKGFITKDNYDISSKYSRDYSENLKQLRKKRDGYVDEIHGDGETYNDKDFFKKLAEKRYASERKKMILDYIEAKKSGINKYTTLENPYNGEIVVPFKNYPKSAIGNNGMFDMTNPNIYKSLIPATGIGYLISKQQQ